MLESVTNNSDHLMMNKLVSRFIVTVLLGLAGAAGHAGTVSAEPLDTGHLNPERDALLAQADVSSIHRLYLAYFDREPDAVGFWFWVDRFDDGNSLRSISDQFAESPEYIDTYGQLDDGAFVDQVYLSVLARSPDASGRAHWLERMEAGLSRGEVMIAFSDSTEYKVSTGFVSQPAILRLYRAVFLRDADPAGLRFWLDQAATGRPLSAISNDMVLSDEFIARYGELDNQGFVLQVYTNVLGRDPDDGGAMFWLDQLERGVSWGEMVAEFASSDEYQATTRLIDPVRPLTPDRPAAPAPTGSIPVAPIPVIAPVGPLPVLPQLPPVEFDCGYGETEVELTELSPTTYELRLRFQYIELGNCGENLESATIQWSGPNAGAWELQPVSGSYFHPVHYRSVRFVVPADALTSDLELPYDVLVETPGDDLDWSGTAVLPLQHDITFSMPPGPLVHGFEPVSIDASVTVAPHPDAPNREITVEALIFGRCIVDTLEPTSLGDWVTIGNGRGEVTADISMTVLTGRGSCAFRVRVSNSPSSGQGDIERALHDGSVFEVAGDASCPEGVCTITMTVLDPLQGVSHSINTWGLDDHTTFSATYFDRTPAAGEHSFTATHENTEGFCLRHGMFESLLGWADGTRCYEPVLDSWVEVPVPAD